MTSCYTIEAARLVYRGYEIYVDKMSTFNEDANRTSWYIRRQSDMVIVKSDFHYIDKPASDYGLYLQTVIDQELAKESPWMEVRN